MNRVSLVLPYYMNPGMLEKQFALWNSYPEEIKPYLEIVIVDDASPKGQRAEEVITEKKLSLGNIRLSLYRVLTELRWNQHGARNIGAHEAHHDFLMLTDMDHMISPDLMTYLITGNFEKRSFYMFDRVNYRMDENGNDAPDK